MQQKSPNAIILIAAAAAVSVCTICSTADVAAQDTRPAVSESVLEQVEMLGDRRGSNSATRQLAERGETIVPELITALEDALDEMARYDPYNLGDHKDTYSSMLDRQYHLMTIIGSNGSTAHVSRLTGIADKIRSENMAASSYFGMLDNLGAQQEADRIAALVIADPNSDEMKLFAAMARYYRWTPAAVADSAALHFDKKLSINRAGAYQLIINAGRGDEVRARLIDEVGKLEYTGTGNKAMLQALAVIDEPESFLPRLEVLRLQPSAKRAATLVNGFTWSSDKEREAMLPDMLNTDNSELDLYAIEFMLENGRTDLLEEYRLAWPAMRQFEYYQLLIPGFAEMPRERLLRYLSPEEVDRIEWQKSNPIMPMTTPTMRLALQRLGYALEKRAGTIVIIPPIEQGV